MLQKSLTNQRDLSSSILLLRIRVRSGGWQQTPRWDNPNFSPSHKQGHVTLPSPVCQEPVEITCWAVTSKYGALFNDLLIFFIPCV